jgi:predicted PurR-regulated permease PerM
MGIRLEHSAREGERRRRGATGYRRVIMARINEPKPTALPPELPRPEIILPTEFRNVVLTAILAILILYTLYFARAVFVPLLLALLLRLFLQLPLNFLTRLGIPRLIAVLIVMAGLLGGLGLLGTAIGGPASDWIAKAPASFGAVQNRLEFIKRPLEVLENTAHQIEHVVVAPSPSTPIVSVAGPGIGGMLASSTQSLIQGVGTVIFLLFFLLASGDTFKRRLVEIMPRLSDKKRAVEIVNEIEDSISGFLLRITVINAGLALLTGLGFFLCGVPVPALWGAIAFFFNFVPFIGPLSAGAIFFMVGLFTFEGWRMVLPVGIYACLVIVESQAITPTVMARRFSLNPVAVAVSLVFWFWMWGTLGALLAVPMLAAFKVVCDHIGPLNAVGHMLEGSS